MNDDPRVEQLLEKLLDSHATPEEVCGSCPELLPTVRDRLRQVRRLEADLDAFFPPPDAAPPPPAGAALPRIAGYEVEAVLGRGGMGIVYQARHLRLNRTVALKMLLLGAYAGAHDLARFRREAEAVAGLRHENIVRVHDAGDHDGCPYFTMELVEGGSLAQKLRGTPQAARQAAALAATLAGAVQVAHQGGIVHRDLKPGNILLTADGTPKISDFGLARRLQEGGAGLTQSGVQVGTPSYMAPEQARGDKGALGPATDVYALGAILYECLTGRPPFQEETSAATLRRVLASDPVAPSLLNPRVPRDLETICLKCLNKDPAKRYPTAADLAADVGRFLKHEPIQARPPGRGERCLRWVRRRPAAAALVSALGLLAAAGAVSALSLYQQQAAAHDRQALTDQEVRGILERARGSLEDGWQAVDLAKVTQAVSEANRAVDIARGGTGAARQDAEAFQQDAGARLDRVRKNRALLDAVLDVSVSSEIPPYTPDPAGRVLALAQPGADEQYAVAFRRWGLDVDGTPEDEAVARLRQEPDFVIQELIAGLDAWMLERRALRRPEAEWRRPFRVADQLDRGDRSRRLRALLSEGRPGAEAAPGLREVRNGIDPRTEPALTVVLLSRACALAGDDAGAEEVLRRAVTARPDQVVLLTGMAKLLDRPRHSRLEEAIGYYRAARGQRPGLGLGLSWALVRAGRPAEAEEVLRELALRQPGNLAVHFYLGSSLSAQEKYAEAAAANRKAIDLKPDFVPAYVNLGYALDGLGKYDQAEAAMRKAIELQPDLAPAHQNLGAALQGQKRYGEAEAAYRTAISLKPDYAEAYSNLGNTLRRQGRREEGEAAYRKAIDLEPALAVAHVNLGGALFERGKFGDAEAEFRTAARLKPDSVLAHYNLGNALREQRKYGEAEAAYRKAIDLKPDYAAAHSNLGHVLDEQGKYGEAEAAYRKAIDLRPDLAEPHYLLGRALMRRGQFREAAPLLKKCADLVPPGMARQTEVRNRLRACERFLILEARLPAILSGAEKPASAAERIEFAELCLLKKRSAAAARLYAEAFAMGPTLAENPRTGLRYAAACSAALAGCGRGEGAAELGGAERARWRRQALEWLRADLTAWVGWLDGDPAARRAVVHQALTYWQENPDLACVRDPGELGKLTADERKEFVAFWTEAAAVLARTEK
jgi:serine/threonine-protein kinase